MALSQSTYLPFRRTSPFSRIASKNEPAAGRDRRLGYVGGRAGLARRDTLGLGRGRWETFVKHVILDGAKIVRLLFGKTVIM